MGNFFWAIFIGFLLMSWELPLCPVNPPNREQRNRSQRRNTQSQQTLESGKKWGQGMRGCPYIVGKLAILGAEGESTYFLNTGKENPIVVYQIISDNPENFVITLTEVRGKFERLLIYEKKLVVQGNKYLLIQLPSLKQQQQYELSAAILCEGKAAYGTTLDVWVNRVEEITSFDQLVEKITKDEKFEALQIN
ncbi:hypothetical protein [Gloeothece verrucosa]|uniref:DUF928 domain-containing protein n=1 Tax=Gloeothece verrucosa (strain PCC 7822) TaxID=497965 RepID=E0UMK5_GLOV7|nr:hypothetical protein [Gloeothece verrucosa]ADN18185.1 hypothetical protein Cyan7822_6401 [Gloeothece verrucosa PCC 7822]